MMNPFDKGDQDGAIWEYLDDLDFYAGHPEEGWSSKKKMYEILFHIQTSMKSLTKFKDEDEWVKARLETIEADIVKRKSK